MVKNILQNSTVDNINTPPPVKPKGGEVYLVQSKHLNDWKCDKYTWINYSKCVSKHDEEGGKLIMCYFKLRNERGSQKTVFNNFF